MGKDYGKGDSQNMEMLGEQLKNIMNDHSSYQCFHLKC